MREKINESKGITLIALVITVIVLLILAGVSIAMLTGDNGILTQASNAKEENEKAKLKEEGKLDMNDTYMQTQQVEAYEISSTDEDFSNWVTDGSGAITAYNGNLTEVVIPSKIGNETITTIGKSGNIFGDNKSNITKVTISKGITNIPGYTFFGCSNLQKIIIPNTVTSIGMCAFAQTKISSIIIPDGVTTLDISAIVNCSDLREIKLSENIKNIKSSNFIGTGLYEIRIPNKVENMEQVAIFSCPNVEEIYIPSSVITMGYESIGNCPNLKKVYCEATSKPDGWNDSWIGRCPNAEVVWGYTGN